MLNRSISIMDLKFIKKRYKKQTTQITDTERAAATDPNSKMKVLSNVKLVSHNFWSFLVLFFCHLSI